MAHRRIPGLHLPGLRWAIPVADPRPCPEVVFRAVSRSSNSCSHTGGTGVLRVQFTVHLRQVQPDPHLFAPVHFALRLHAT